MAKLSSIKKVSSEYISHRPHSDYDSVHFVVNHEVESSDHIQVRHDVADRWRSTSRNKSFQVWPVARIISLIM